MKDNDRALLDAAERQHWLVNLEAVRRSGTTSRQWRRRVRRLREVLLDGGGESDLERRFLRLMCESGLPRPRPQLALRRDTLAAKGLQCREFTTIDVIEDPMYVVAVIRAASRPR